MPQVPYIKNLSTIILVSIIFYLTFKLPTYQLLSGLGLLYYFPLVCGVVAILHVMSITFIKANKTPSTIIIVCVGIAPSIITAILHILFTHNSLYIVSVASLFLGWFSTTLMLPMPHGNTISNAFGQKNVMTMDGISSGAGQGSGAAGQGSSGAGQGGRNWSHTWPGRGFVLIDVVPKTPTPSGVYPLPAIDGSYENKAIHIASVPEAMDAIIYGFHTDGRSNRIAGRLIADHLAWLRQNEKTPNSANMNQSVVNWLRGWSSHNNQEFNRKVFRDIKNDKPRFSRMPNNQGIRNQLKNLN